MVLRTTTITRNPDGTTRRDVQEQTMGKGGGFPGGGFPGMGGMGGMAGGRQMSPEDAAKMQKEMKSMGKQILKEVGKAAVSAAGNAIKDAAARRAKGVVDSIAGFFGGGKKKKG